MKTGSALFVDDPWIGEMKGVSVNGRRALLARLDDRVFAYEARCAHPGVPPSEGTLTVGGDRAVWSYEDA